MLTAARALMPIAAILLGEDCNWNTGHALRVLDVGMLFALWAAEPHTRDLCCPNYKIGLSTKWRSHRGHLKYSCWTIEIRWGEVWPHQNGLPLSATLQQRCITEQRHPPQWRPLLPSSCWDVICSPLWTTYDMALKLTAPSHGTIFCGPLINVKV